MKNLLCVVILLLLRSSALAEVDGDGLLIPGVFCVREFNSPTAAIKGTCVLIDKEYGWILTAGHVIRECGLASTNASVFINNEYVLYGAPTEEQHFQPLLECKVIGAGCDFMIATEAGGGTNDWVLLQLRNPEDFRYLNLYIAYPPPGDQTPFELRKLAQSQLFSKWTGNVLGYPTGTSVLTPAPAQFGSFDEKPSGLWQVTTPVAPKDSGGPFVNGRSLLGIVLQVAKSTTGADIASQADVLATYSILPKLAKAIPPTPRVSLIQRFFSQTSSNQNRIILFTQLVPLNSVEHYQLMTLLCDQKDEKVKQFIMETYSTYFVRNKWILDRVWKCSDSAAKMALMTGANEIISRYRENDSSAVSSGLTIAQLIAEHVRNERDELSAIGIDQDLIAKNLLDEIYVRFHVLKQSTVASTDESSINWVAGRSPNNPNLGLARLDIATRSLAARSLADLSSYGWESVVSSSRSSARFTTKAMAETNGIDYYSVSSGTNALQLAKRGEAEVISSNGWWASATNGLRNDALVASWAISKPEDEAETILSHVKELVPFGGNYVGKISDDGAKALIGHNSEGTNWGGSVEFFLNDGILRGYEVHVKGDRVDSAIGGLAIEVQKSVKIKPLGNPAVVDRSFREKASRIFQNGVQP